MIKYHVIGDGELLEQWTYLRTALDAVDFWLRYYPFKRVIVQRVETETIGTWTQADIK